MKEARNTDAFYPYATGILKKMAGIKENKLVDELEDLLDDSEQQTEAEEEETSKE